MSTRTIAGLSVGSVGDARWFAAHPAKAWGERLYLLYAPVWMTAMAVVQHSDAYRAWRDVGHLLFSLALFLPLWVIPVRFRRRPIAGDRSPRVTSSRSTCGSGSSPSSSRTSARTTS